MSFGYTCWAKISWNLAHVDLNLDIFQIPFKWYKMFLKLLNSLLLLQCNFSVLLLMNTRPCKISEPFNKYEHCTNWKSILRARKCVKRDKVSEIRRFTLNTNSWSNYIWIWFAGVLQSLTQLSTTTSILSDPSKVPEQATAAVTQSSPRQRHHSSQNWCVIVH